MAVVPLRYRQKRRRLVFTAVRLIFDQWGGLGGTGNIFASHPAPIERKPEYDIREGWKIGRDVSQLRMDVSL
jgi:hypothetical protein